MNTEKELLEQDLSALEINKDTEGMKAFIEDAKLLGHEDLVQRAEGKLQLIVSAAQAAETTSPSAVSQVEEMGGSLQEIENRTAGTDSKIAEVKAETTEKVNSLMENSSSESAGAMKSQTGEELERESTGLVKRENLSVEQKAYLDGLNLLKEKTIEEDKKFSEERGLIQINDRDTVKMEDFLKDQNNIYNINFNYRTNLSNIDQLLQAGVPAEKLLGVLSVDSKQSAVNNIMLFPKDVKEKLYTAISGNDKFKTAAKDMGRFFAQGSEDSSGDSKFTEMIQFVSLPLTHNDRNYIYPNYLEKSKIAKQEFEARRTEKKESSYELTAMCTLSTGLASLFQASKVKYFSREEAVNLAKESLLNAYQIKNPEFVRKISKNVLALQKVGQISEEEANQILEAPLA